MKIRLTSRIQSAILAILVIISCLHYSNASESNSDYDIEEDADIPTIEGTGEPYKIIEEDDVLVLNKENFHHVISTKKLILVEFYAPWCGHCKSLEPEYATAASALVKEGIRIAKVDATIDEDLAKEFDVSGFPTLKLFKDGTFFEDFDSQRTSTGIIEYMRKHADPNYTPPPSAVKELDASNFDIFVTAPISLVEFYAPWCGHCKKLAPEYEAAAGDLETENISLGKVDATVERDLAQRFGVTGYPKLFIFRDGKSVEYKGPRDRTGIVEYMKKQSKPPSQLVSKLTEAKNLISRTEPCIFAYFDSENDHFLEYLSAANHIRDDYSFVHTFAKDLSNKFDLSENSVNIVFPEIYHSKFENKKLTFDLNFGDSEKLLKWIRENIVPLVGERTRSNIAIRYAKRPLVVVYYDVNFSHQYVKATQLIRHKILPVASKFKKFTFAISNEEEFDDELKNVGLDDSGSDVNVAIYGDQNLRYAMEPDDDFDNDVLEEFVKKFDQGHLRPFFKSQPIPKVQKGPVRVVVAKTFEKDVLFNDQDVLIEFYAPWCGHCKKLEPVYTKLAKYFVKENPNVLVAKMDATANDVHPSLKVEGFPTIYLLKASDKQNPVQFKGADRTFKGLKDFILKELKSSEGKDEL